MKIVKVLIVICALIFSVESRSNKIREDFSRISSSSEEFKRPYICYMPYDMGPCEGLVLRYYYNYHTRSCETFHYGGCKGNANNFKTKKECEKRCLR